MKIVGWFPMKFVSTTFNQRKVKIQENNMFCERALSLDQ